MIRGESGTGRRVVAQAIHMHRANGSRFVTVDCAALPPEELERELFGSGPSSTCVEGDPIADPFERVSRTSRLHDAIGGTCYLRDVAAASPRVQARLVRVLCRREAVLVETGQRLLMDVRPVAGVEPHIDRVVREGLLRQDLYSRLAAIRIDMPPLRRRREDIPAIANYFLRDICTSRKMALKTLSEAALTLVVALPWRSNAPELRDVLQMAAASSAETSISLETILAVVRLDGGSAAFATRRTLRQAHAHFEREYIAAVLERHRGSVSEAARTLGIERANLYRKLRGLRADGHTVAAIRKYHSRHIA
jgi:DNA-binding NtrC family response regulator